MKSINNLIIFSSLIIAVGCSMEEQQPVNEMEEQVIEKEITIQAICEDSGSKTRTILDEDNGTILWTPGDALSVFYGSGTNGGSKFISNATEAAATTSFTGKITSAPGDDATYYWGVYPYSEDTSCDGSTVTITLPSYQEAVPGTFANGLFPAIGRSEGLTMGFFNICGGWRFSLTYEGVRRVILKSNDGELITGKAKIGFDVKGKPEIKEITDGYDEVVLEAPSGQFFEPEQYYYIALLPTVFNSGFTMTFETYTETGTYNRTAKTAIFRSRISGISHLDDYLTEGFGPKEGGIPIEDQDFKEFLVSEDQEFDTDGDGEISYEEAAAIEEVKINTKEIESIAGIEYMTSLKTLICTGEVMTRASGGVGRLTSLDVSNNKELEYLDCSYNQITSLDISNNLNLTYLDCSPMDNETGDNQLAELYVSTGQIIDGVTVDRSNEYIPEETEIIYVGDVVMPSDFPDESFRTYVLKNFDTNKDGVLSEEECNNVWEITVNTDSIGSLQGIEHFPNLFNLTCSSTEAGSGKLTNLDLSNNSNLSTLDCSGNQLASLDVSNNTDLYSLSCRNNQLTSIDVSENTLLSTLDCSGNLLASLDVSNNTDLHSLSCRNNQLTSIDVLKNRNLTELICAPMNDASGNNLLTTLKVTPLHFITNVTVDRNDDYIPSGTQIVIDPFVHLSSSYGDLIREYWTEDYGATFYNVNVLNVNENSPDNCIFQADINASFLTYPRSASDAGKLYVNNIESTSYYFNKKRTEAISRIGDKNVRFRVSNDGKSLYATILNQSGNVTVSEELVANIINEPTFNEAGFLYNNVFSYVKGGEVSGQLINTGEMYVYIGGNVTLKSGLVCPITYDGNDSFRANLRRPVSIASTSYNSFVAGDVESLCISNMLIDWRMRSFYPYISIYRPTPEDYLNPDNFYYLGFYGPIENVVFDIGSAECDLGGTRQPLPASISLSYSNGVLTYKNNSVSITTNYSIFIKLTVKYGFGVLSDWIRIPVTTSK